MKNTATIWLAALLMTLAVPLRAQDKAGIEELNARFVAAFNSGDFAKVASLYAENAYVLPPGSGVIKGRSNIQAFWTKAGEGLGDVKLVTVEVTPLSGSAAREIGTFTGRTKGASPQDVGGKYVVIWQKEADQWRITTDIWNSTK
jgi:uncharacterized protein (TIGR02246 family)